jgi:hypothetical protein
MLTAFVVLLRTVGLMCRGHRAVALETLALRQQLAALMRRVNAAAPQPGSALLDSPCQGRAGVAYHFGRGAAGHRPAMAPPMAPSALDAALQADSSGPPEH